MAISIRGSGGPWAASNATTQVAVLEAHQTGDMLIVRTIRKPFTNPDDIVINTAGWNEVAPGVANGSTANGNGTGSMAFKAFWKIAESASEPNPTVTWGTTSAPGAVCAVTYQLGANEVWVTPTGNGGGDATARTSQTSTIATHISVTAGDMVDFFRGQCDDSGALTVPNITQTGVTFAAVSEQPAAAGLFSTSNDLATDGGYRLATAGTSSAAAVVTGTSAASEQHGAWMTRLRVAAAPKSVHAQAQAHIKSVNVNNHGQAQAYIKSTARGFGQTQAFVRGKVFGTHLTTSSTDVDGTNFDTASITPGANKLILAAIWNGATAVNPVPTVTGNGLTWVRVITPSVEYDVTGTFGVLHLFRAMGASPSAGAVDIDYGAQTVLGVGWSITEWDGVDTSGTNGSGAIVQAVSNLGLGNTADVTLSAFSHADNVTYGALAQQTADVETLEADYLRFGRSATATPVTSITTFWKSANDTTVGASWTTATEKWGIIGVEIKAAIASTNVHGQAQALITRFPHAEYYNELAANAIVDPVVTVSGVDWKEGNRVFVVATGRDEGLDSTPTVTATGLTFSNVGYEQTVQNVLWMGIWKSELAAGDGTDIDVVLNVLEGGSGHAGGINVQVIVVGGNSPDIDVWDIVDTGAADTDSPSIDITTTVANTKIFSFFNTRQRTFTIDSGDNLIAIRENDQADIGGNISSLSVYYKEVTSTNTYNSSGTFVTALDWQAASFAVKQGVATKRSYGQAQAEVKQTYFAHAQAQASIKTTARGHGQSQGLINGIFTQVIDTFTRSVTDGLGTADDGGDWTFISGTAANADVDGAAGTIQPDVSIAYVTNLRSVIVNRESGISIKFRFKFDVLPDSTFATFFNIEAGLGSTSTQVSGYRLALTYNSTTVVLNPSAGANGSATGFGADIPVVANTWYIVESTHVRTSGGQLRHRAKIYEEGTTSPAYGSRAGANGLVYPGHVGLRVPLRASGNLPLISFDDLEIKDAGWTESGLAQARIKQTYFGLGQAQAQIKNTYWGHGQAQAEIIVAATTARAHAQAQAQIKQVYFGLGQAQADIKATSFALGQAQARIKQVYFAHAQSQAQIKNTYRGLGQAQASIKAIGVTKSAQAQARIYGDGALVWVKDTFTRSLSNDLGTPDIGPTYVLYSSTNNFTIDGSKLIVQGNDPTDSATMDIGSPTGAYFSDSTIEFRIPSGLGTITEAEVDVLARTGGSVPGILDGYARSSSIGVNGQVHAVPTPDNGNSASFTLNFNIDYILKMRSKENLLLVKIWEKSTPEPEAWNVTVAIITPHDGPNNGIYIRLDSTGGSQIWIDNYSVTEILDLHPGQSQARIKQTYTNSTGQAQAQIKQSYYAHAQAQAQIKQTYWVHAQSQAQIKQTSTGLGQAQAYIMVLLWKDTFSREVSGEWGTPDYGTRYSSLDSQGEVTGTLGTTTSFITTEQGNMYGVDSGIVQFDVFSNASSFFSHFEINLGYWSAAVSGDDGWSAGVYGLTGYAGISPSPGPSEWWTFKFQFGPHARTKAWKVGTVEPDWQGVHLSPVPRSTFGQGFLLTGSTPAPLIDNIYIYKTTNPIIVVTLGQAQADIKQVYYVHGQASAWIKQTYFGLGQSQAWIENTYSQHGQAQAWIENTYNVHGQSQAQIKQVYYVHGQANAWIEQTYFGLGQAQSQIKTTYVQNGQAQASIKQTYSQHGQAQADIKQIYLQHGQAQANIKQVYWGHGQSNAWIEQTYFAHGQAQAWIEATYVAHAQAQAEIKQTYTSHGQAQGYIKTVGNNAHGQAQALIITTYLVHAQAQAKINAYGVNAHGQAQGNIKFDGNAVFGQAQAKINAFDFNQHAQAQGTIEQIYSQHAQAQANIKQTYNGHAQAQGTILTTYFVHAQAQADIKQIYLVHAQSEAWIENTYDGYAQAQARIKNTYYGHGQVNAKINAFGVSAHAQAQAYIIQPGTTAHGQANAKIKAIGVNAFGQAQSWIETTYNQHGQAQAIIKQTYYVVGQANAYIYRTEFGLGQAQSEIKQVYRQYAQSQAWIKTTDINKHGQAQGRIKNTYFGSGQANAYIILVQQGYGQAQALIKRTQSASGQAQATILRTYTIHGNAQAWIETTINSSGQAQGLIGAVGRVFGQAQASITSVGTIAHAQAQAAIFRPEAFGQAQAFIATVHTLDNVTVTDDMPISLVLSDEADYTTLGLDDDSISVEVDDIGINITLEDDSIALIELDDEAF